MIFYRLILKTCKVFFVNARISKLLDSFMHKTRERQIKIEGKQIIQNQDVSRSELVALRIRLTFRAAREFDIFEQNRWTEKKKKERKKESMFVVTEAVWVCIRLLGNRPPPPCWERRLSELSDSLEEFKPTESISGSRQHLCV